MGRLIKEPKASIYLSVIPIEQEAKKWLPVFRLDLAIKQKVRA
jgi:hypothetical protein